MKLFLGFAAKDAFNTKMILLNSLQVLNNIKEINEQVLIRRYLTYILSFLGVYFAAKGIFNSIKDYIWY